MDGFVHEEAAVTQMSTHPPAGQNVRRVGLLLLGFAATLLVVLLPYLPGLLGACVLYVMVAPVHRRAVHLAPARVSAAALCLVLLLLFLIPGGWLVSTVVNEATDAVRAFERGGGLRHFRER